MNPLYKKLKTIVTHSTESRPRVVAFDKNSGNPTLINSLNQTIFQINEFGQWIYLNAEWEKLTGFSVTETLGTDVIYHVHPDDKKQCADFLQSIYKNTLSASRRIRFLTKAGHLCWVNMRTNSFVNPMNNKTHLVGVISDITDRVREYGLHQANYRTLHTLISNLCGLVYRGRNDHDWTMEFVSEGAFALTGYQPSELINQTVTFGSLINPNDQDLVWTNVQSALRENRPYDINYRIRTSNNQEKWVWERGKGNFSSNGELLGIEGLIVDITDYKRNKLKENEEVLYRTKTKLPKKHLFLDRLSMAIVKTRMIDSYSYALLIIYIDRFKNLQDKFPADVIDEMIIIVSEKINAIINATDSLCLFGDGEFGLLLEHTQSMNTVRTITKNIHDELLAPVKIHNTETFLTTSIGVCLSTHNTSDRKSVIKDAYTALNRAKALGGGRFEIVDEDTNAAVYALDRMEKEIHYALKNNELLLCYQPIIAAQDSLVDIYESQLFWLHPRRGKISADAFASLNTCAKTVDRLNHWIITAIVEQAKVWESQINFAKNLHIVIQFFGENIFTDNLLKQVEQQLLGTISDNFHFSINIPIQIIHSLSEESIATLTRLNKKNLGLIITTDKSTLAASEDLLALTADTIKLNSTVTKRNAEYPAIQKINKAQIDYIHAIGKKIIAAGIDTKEKIELIKPLNYDYLQGRFISRPLAGEDLIQFMNAHD